MDTSLLQVTTAPDAAPVSPLARPARQPPTVPRVLAWLIPAVLAVPVSLLGHSFAGPALALLLAFVVAAALTGSGPEASLVAMLPTGFVIVVAWGLTWGLVAGLAPWEAWGSPAAAVSGVVVLAALAGLAARGRGGAIVLVGRDGPALVGAGLLAAYYAWILAVQPLAWWSRITGAGTDFLRHVGSTRDVLLAGELDVTEAGYPKALYALGSILAEVTGTDPTAEGLWRLVAPTGFLMLVLMLLAIMSIARRAVDLVGRPASHGVIAAVIAAAVFLQTAWFSSFLAFGSIMNILVGLCLVAVLGAGLQPGVFGTGVGTVTAASAAAVTANAWQLMVPVVGLVAMPFLVTFVRRRRRIVLDWYCWALAGLLVVHGFLALREIGTGHTATATVSNLFHPDWWWWPALVLAIGCCAAAGRAGRRAWAMAAAGGLLGGIVLVAGLMLLTGSTWDLMLYYPVKAMWTSMVIAIPLATAGGVLLAGSAWFWSGGRGPLAGPVLRGIVVLVVAVIVVGVIGRGAAFRPHLVLAAQARFGMPTWALGLLEAIEAEDLPEERQPGAIVFGLVPDANLQTFTSGYPGAVDYMAMEALDLLDVEGALDAPVKVGLMNRDMTQVCRYLMDHPDSLRISGPNPGAGWQWIVDSGCPERIVRPDRWMQVQLDSEWLERSGWEAASAPWRFPSYQEVTSTR